MTQQHHRDLSTWECKYHVVFIPKYRKKRFGVIEGVWATCSMNWHGGAKARSKKAIWCPITSTC